MCSTGDGDEDGVCRSVDGVVSGVSAGHFPSAHHSYARTNSLSEQDRK